MVDCAMVRMIGIAVLVGLVLWGSHRLVAVFLDTETRHREQI